ncbi:MAG: T9SS type A sorting domain-containing protein [Ignavibacteria bacterium]|nr:T9SS type A sorting domain-containing protein [Ignavibacteria bacterium]
MVNEKLSPGNYEFEFNGSGLSSGIYFYKLEAGNFSETRRMILLK